MSEYHIYEVIMIIKRLSILVVIFIGLQSVGLYPFEQTNNGIQLVVTDYSQKPHETIISLENYTQPILAGKLIEYGYKPVQLQIRNTSEKTIIFTPQDINVPIIKPDVLARTFSRGYVLSPLAKGFGAAMIFTTILSLMGQNTVNREGKRYKEIKDHYQQVYSDLYDGKKLQQVVTEKNLIYEKSFRENFQAAVNNNTSNNPSSAEQFKTTTDNLLKAQSELNDAKDELNNKINKIADYAAFSLINTMQMCGLSIFPAAYYAWNAYRNNKQITQIFRDALFHSACEIKPKQTTDLLIFVDKNTDLSQFTVQVKDIQGTAVTTFFVKL
jgi:hypothetical protein